MILLLLPFFGVLGASCAPPAGGPGPTALVSLFPVRVAAKGSGHLAGWPPSGGGIDNLRRGCSVLPEHRKGGANQNYNPQNALRAPRLELLQPPGLHHCILSLAGVIHSFIYSTNIHWAFTRYQAPSQALDIAVTKEISSRA